MAVWLLVLQVTIMGRPVSLAVLAALMLALLISMAGIVVGVIFKRRIDAIAPPLEDDLDDED
jgi:hypothetical protein